MEQKYKVLIIDDEESIRSILSESLVDEGYDVSVASSADEAYKVIHKLNPDVVFLDIWMPGMMDGLEFLHQLDLESLDAEFVVMSGHGNVESAVKATKLGAWDFVEKPLSMDKITILIENILAFQKVRKEKRTLLNQLRKNIAVVGVSEKIKKIKQYVARISLKPTWVFLQGEAGTGKHILAENIHFLSQRSTAPFLKVHLCNIPEDLFEHELWGYENGAIDGVQTVQKGKLELAHGGTLYISAVDRLPIKLQKKLLDFLRTSVSKRIGSDQEHIIDVRVITSSRSHIHEKIEKGEFLKELYDLLSLTKVNLPLLKDRKEDIPTLVQHFSNLYIQKTGASEKRFTDESLRLLSQYSWPGNVRELQNFVDRIHILSNGPTVGADDLIQIGLNVDLLESLSGDSQCLKEARSRFEKDFILKRLEENKGNISKTAESIGLERSHLHRKIKAYGIEV